jgi:hypothetical protein
MIHTVSVDLLCKIAQDTAVGHTLNTVLLQNYIKKLNGKKDTGKRQALDMIIGSQDSVTREAFIAAFQTPPLRTFLSTAGYRAFLYRLVVQFGSLGK